MVYEIIRCPFCNGFYEERNKGAKRYREPFLICKKCHNTFVDQSSYEPAALPPQEHEAEEKIPAGSLFAYFLIISVVVFGGCFIPEYRIAFIIISLFWIFILAVIIYSCIKSAKTEKDNIKTTYIASLRRMCRIDYAERLKSHGFFVPPIYLNPDCEILSKVRSELKNNKADLELHILYNKIRENPNVLYNYKPHSFTTPNNVSNCVVINMPFAPYVEASDTINNYVSETYGNNKNAKTIAKSEAKALFAYLHHLDSVENKKISISCEQYIKEFQVAENEKDLFTTRLKDYSNIHINEVRIPYEPRSKKEVREEPCEKYSHYFYAFILLFANHCVTRSVDDLNKMLSHSEHYLNTLLNFGNESLPVMAATKSTYNSIIYSLKPEQQTNLHNRAPYTNNHCSSCGNVLEPNAHFCGYCGAKI